MADDRSVLSRPAKAPDDVVAYDTDPDQIADVRFGDARALKRPLVLIVHGGFWRPTIDRAHTGPMAEALAAAGWTVACAEYRRVPQHPDLTLADITLALEKMPALVSRHNGRVVLMGHSAGGHLVLWAAAARRTQQLAGTLALGPAADLRLAHQLKLGDGAAQAFLGTDPKDRADADPNQLPSPTIPTTIIHGEQDDVVPIALAESYVATHARVKLVRLPGAGHFAVIDPLSAAWGTVVEELHALSAYK